MRNTFLLLLFLFSFTSYSQTKIYEGEKDGYMEYRLVSDDGRTLENGTFWEGKKDGYWYSYHKNGTISAIAQFNNDKRVGTWKFFDEEGELRGKVVYKDNRRVSAVLIKDFDNS